MFVRRAEHKDIDSIQKLLSDEFQNLTDKYGVFSVTKLIENHILSVVCEENKQIVGFASFSCVNEKLSENPEKFSCFQNLYQCLFYSKTEQVSGEIYSSVFVFLPYLQTIFDDANKKEIKRSNVMGGVKVRAGRVEDFDDVLKLLDQNLSVHNFDQKKLLSSLQGFGLGKVFVGVSQADKTIVGVVCFNNDMNEIIAFCLQTGYQDCYVTFLRKIFTLYPESSEISISVASRNRNNEKIFDSFCSKPKNNGPLLFVCYQSSILKENIKIQTRQDGKEFVIGEGEEEEMQITLKDKEKCEIEKLEFSEKLPVNLVLFYLHCLMVKLDVVELKYSNNDKIFYGNVLKRNMCFNSKIQIYSRIVIVGSSLSGIACLKTILKQEFFHFNNLTLISPDGIFHESEPKHIFVKPRNCKVVKDFVKSLDEKAVYLSEDSGSKIFYDYLILVPSRPFLFNKKVKVLLNYRENLDVSLLEEKKFVVIYGTTLEAFRLANVLQKRAVQFTHVLPKKLSTLFDDEQVKERILEEMKKRGDVYNGFSFKAFQIRTDKTVNVLLENSEKTTRLVPSDCFINCQVRSVSIGLLRAFKEQSLVFDGRLLVDPDFKTTNPFVLSAGPLAKFSRKFGLSSPMETFNSSEVGRALCYCLFKSLGYPSKYNLKIQPKLSSLNKVPVFSKPTHKEGTIGDNLTYVCTEARSFQKKDCSSYSTTSNGTYFCLHVNSTTNQISRLVLLGKESSVYSRSFRHLVGVSVKYCNNLIWKYNNGKIDDFVKYFQQDWARYLFEKEFRKMRKQFFGKDVEKQIVEKKVVKGIKKSGLTGKVYYCK